MAKPALRIAIVNGRIDGLCAALSLASDGHEVDVDEQARAIGEIGAAAEGRRSAKATVGQRDLTD